MSFLDCRWRRFLIDFIKAIIDEPARLGLSIISVEVIILDTIVLLLRQLLDACGLVQQLDFLALLRQLLQQVLHRLIIVAVCIHHDVLFHIGRLDRGPEVMGRDLLPHLGLLDDFFQLLNLILVLLEERIFRVLVHSRLVLDVFGAGRIPQRRESFFVIVVCWRDGCDHDGLGIASQRVLQ